MSRPRPVPRSLLLLGAGELGKELAISAQRLGLQVIAVDRYPGAPAMQVAQVAEVVALDDAAALEGIIRTHRPDLVVPEIEPVPVGKLHELEEQGFRIIPTAEAASLTLDREATRSLAAHELGLPTPRFDFASSEVELQDVCEDLGFPCLARPVVGFAGQGQTVITGPARVQHAWSYALEGGTGEHPRVMVEEQVESDLEVTQLTVREWDGSLRFVEPIGSRRERGAFREAWSPAGLSPAQANKVREASGALVERLGGAGVYAAEFLVAGDRVLFSDLRARPGDTGMVTLISQDLSQFDLHVRAMLGLPIPTIRYHGPGACAVILADRDGTVSGYEGLDRALQVETSQLRIFGKPRAASFRRMGVALAAGTTTEEARTRALESAARVEIRYG